MMISPTFCRMLLTFISTLACVVPAASHAAQRAVLMTGGKTDYAVCRPENASSPDCAVSAA